MVKVKKIKVLAYAKVQAVMCGFAGIIAGLIYSVGGTVYDVVTTGTVNKGTALAYFAIPVMPLYFAFWGFVAGIVGAFLYNITSKWFGGIKIDIKR